MPNKTRKENNPRLGGGGGGGGGGGSSRSKSNGDSAAGNNGAAGDATAAVGGKLGSKQPTSIGRDRVTNTLYSQLYTPFFFIRT